MDEGVHGDVDMDVDGNMDIHHHHADCSRCSARKTDTAVQSLEDDTNPCNTNMNAVAEVHTIHTIGSNPAVDGVGTSVRHGDMDDAAALRHVRCDGTTPPREGAVQAVPGRNGQSLCTMYSS